MTPLAKKVLELFGKPELAAEERGERQEQAAEQPVAGRQGQGKPYLVNRGRELELVIPCDCAPRYRYWAGGQSLAQTLAELNAPPDVWQRYVAGYTETVQ